MALSPTPPQPRSVPAVVRAGNFRKRRKRERPDGTAAKRAEEHSAAASREPDKLAAHRRRGLGIVVPSPCEDDCIYPLVRLRLFEQPHGALYGADFVPGVLHCGLEHLQVLLGPPAHIGERDNLCVRLDCNNYGRERRGNHPFHRCVSFFAFVISLSRHSALSACDAPPRWAPSCGTRTCSTAAWNPPVFRFQAD